MLSSINTHRRPNTKIMKNILLVLTITTIFVGLFLTTLFSKSALSQRTIPSSDNTETNLYLNKGTEYFKSGQYPEAIEQFQKAIQSNPKDPLAYSLIGTAYFLTGREKDGQENMQQAIELYNKAGDYQKAEKLMSFIKNHKINEEQLINLEAKASLKTIQLAEKMLRSDKNNYISCDSTEDCNSKLSLKLSSEHWKYCVFTDDKGGFCSEARENGGQSSWFISEDGDASKMTCR